MSDEIEKTAKFHLMNARYCVDRALDYFPVHTKLLELRKQIEETAKNFEEENTNHDN